MAKVYEQPAHGTVTNFCAIEEDPRPSGTSVYLWGTKHDKNSLTPYFSKFLHQSQNTIGNSSPTNFSNTVNSASTTTKGGQQLRLNKATTHNPSWYDTNSTSAAYWNHPDDSPWMDMDSSLERGQWYPVTDSSESATTYVSHYYSTHTTSYVQGTKAVTSEEEWEDASNPIVGGGSIAYSQQAFFRRAANGRLHGIVRNGNHATATTPDYRRYTWTSASGWPNAYTSYASSGTSTSYNIGVLSDYWSPQYLGVSEVDGAMLFAGTYISTGTNNTTCSIVRAEINANTIPTFTTLATLGFNSRTAVGSHQGGYNLSNKAYRKICSHLFTDPRDATKKAWYYPYFDSYGDFHPSVCSWDTATDTFTINQDITVTGDKSSVHANLTTDSTFTAVTWETGIIVESWVSGGTRYVGYMPFSMPSNPSLTAAARTMMVYSVNSADPTLLTYHSKKELNEVIRNIVWLNDSRTLLGIFHKSTFEVLAFNNATGWEQTALIQEEVFACGRDSLDRIWYTTRNTVRGSAYIDLNLLSPTLPVTVTVTPENTDNQYVGVNINTYINVSAYDTGGSRIAAAVRLVIDSSSVTFTDGTKSKTVTTLTNGELQVDTVISGAGFTNITASVQL
jgi:hypothetical protein